MSDDAKPIFYPRFSSYDWHLLRSPGAGLGNLLFPWARAVLLAERDGGRLIAPTWRNVKLGPILRREKDLRFYSNIFYHRSVGQFLGDLAIKLKNSVRISEDTYLRTKQSSFVVVEGERNHFADLVGAGPVLRDRLVAMTRKPPSDPIRGIAMHIRLGDFIEANDERYQRNSRVALSWFVSEAARLRKLLGPRPITIFTDDTGEAIERAFIGVEDLYFAKTGNAIQDILRLSSAEHIVCSNSTFSLWGIFLSDASFSARFPELFSDYGLASDWVRERCLSGVGERQVWHQS